jgi:uncharacterized protein YjiK/methionine-rich copper-binding protein CopC
MDRRLRLVIALICTFVLLFANMPLTSSNVVTFAAQQAFRGHTNGVTKLVFSPDGLTLASVGRDSVIRLADVASAKELRVLQGHEEPIRAVAFSPDGKTLASAGEDTKVFVWEVATGKLLRVLAGHAGFTNGVAFSPDGKSLVSGSEDARIIVWDTATGKQRRVLRGHAGAVTDVTVSPDGKTIASSSKDKTVKLWDLAAGVQRNTLKGHTDAVTSVAFDVTGANLISASNDKTVRLWDFATKAARRNFTGQAKAVNAAAFSPDGKTVAGGSEDDSIDLWDVASGNVLRSFKKQTKGVTTVEFSPDGKTLASGSKDGTIVLWDIATGTPRLVSSVPSATSGVSASVGQPASLFGPQIAEAAALTAPASALGDGPGGPILVITSASNKFSTYYAEILRSEGFNEFAAMDIGSVSAATLSGYDIAILGQMTLTSAQVTMLSNWVSGGGNLIAMRPDKQLAGLLGLTDAGSTLTNGYLLVDTAQAPGNGIVNQTMQFHSTADRYTLSGATSLATLYTNASTATANPAVSLRAVGAGGGQAAAFTYDLARSIVYMRQGNPAWAAQERDGFTPIRSDDLYYGASATDPQADWVDLDKASIPQADEQQRLLGNLILTMNLDKKPLPRFWYLPFGKKAAVVMSGDDHGNGGTAGRFDAYNAASPNGCSVANWECVRSTSYIYPGTPLTDAQATTYTSQGFEVGLHINTNCADFTATSLESFYVQQISAWAAQLPSAPAPITQRHHCIVWSDWLSAAKTMLNHGMRLDTSYYYWPPNWVQDRPGLFTGSAMPMRLVDTDGTMLDVYEAVTQMTDESGQSYPFTIDTLLDRAVGADGYYGVYTVNAHTDQASSSVSDAVVNSAQSRGVPIVSSKQMLTWLDGRNGSSFGGLSWSGSSLSFTITNASGSNGLQAMVPTHTPSGVLSALALGGSAAAYTTQTIKGVEYAFFNAAAGSYTATYTADTTPPTVTAKSPASGATGVSAGASVTATFSEPVDATTINASIFTLTGPNNSAVPATVTYDGASKTASLQPNSSLAYNTTYTANLTTGVKDLAGNSLAAAVTWSFQTAAAPSCPCSIWGSSATPGTASAGDPNAVELGVKFRSDVDGFITGVRFYKGSANTGTHTGHLWSTSGQLLASLTFANETASGWQQASFSSPVAIAANTTYIVSYHTDTGNYAFDSSFFTTAGVDSAPLHALQNGLDGPNGVYVYGGSGFPTDTYQSSNYWVDVVFTAATSGPDTTPPTVISTAPASGATGVSTAASITATFSEAIDQTTLNASTFTLTSAGGGSVAGTVSYDSASKTASFAPGAALSTNTNYAATVKGGASGVKDLAGNPLAADVTWAFTTAGPSPCATPANPVVAENCLPGNPASEWDVSGVGDTTIQGYATDISVNRGSTVSFKVKTDATNYRIDIYRLGYYGGSGARKITTVQPSAALPQNQPACLTNSTTKLVDCGNWAVSASWAVPSSAVSGIYIARLVRADNGGASHMIFIVRDDTSTSDLLFQTSDLSWQAYNNYGGFSLYGTVANQFDQPNRAYKVSYNRPFWTRGMENGITWVFNAEYPMVRWLEANGYNVSYISGVDTSRFGNLLLNHKVFMSVGHDEYWAGAQRTNVEAARNAGVNLAFFSGNTMFWKTRWENSIDASGTAYRTLVCYKETHDNAKIDPSPEWTGTWRDPRFSPPSDGGQPENAVKGTVFMVNGPRTPPDAISVPAADGKMRFWRNTSIAALGGNQTATLPAGVLGYEWDVDTDNGFRPAGLVRMSTTTVNISSDYLLDYGSTFGAGTATHYLTLYRHSSGALVFDAASIQWSWGLDSNHDAAYYAAPAPDVRMQQATVNLLADMRSQPATLQSGLATATASTDTTPAASTITSPAAGATVPVGSPVTVSGTASDTGGAVGGVEVSVDGGASWHPASGRASWTYSWTPASNATVTIKSRAVDDSGNLETPSAGVTITVGAGGGTAPTVTSVSPTSGTTAGGTAVIITGTGFAAGATVTFGGTAATGVTVVSATQITATTPAGAAGAVNVVVTNSGGLSGTLTNGYTYVAPPAVTSVSPTSGTTAGGTSVTIAGTGFAAGATVTFGGTAATGVTVVSATQITATTPAGAAGAVNVVVTNADGQSATLTGGYTYVAPLPAPTVTGISPTSGTTAGGTSVTITGTNFAAGVTVRFGTTAATNVTVVSATQITATTPTGIAGAVNVVVTNPDGQSATLTSGYTYVAAPAVTSVSPTSGTTAGGTSVTIAGSGFAAGATVTFGGTAATGVTVVSATQITATTPAHAAGAVNVVVTNSGGLSGTLTNGYTYVAPPTVTSVSPNSGPAAGGTSVTITGTNFAAGATVTFGGTAATGVTVVSATQITATTPARAAGVVNVVVTVSGVSGTLANGYTYIAAPTISNLSPTSGSTAGGTVVTITGTNFATGATVRFGTAAAASVTVLSTTQISVTAPAGTAGTAGVTVTTVGGTSNSATYTYVVPIGTPTVLSNRDSNSAGTAEAFQYTASASATVTSLSIYLDTNNSATRVIVGIYSNNTSNNPGTLLGQATITAPRAGAWNTVAIPGVSITSGTRYWIAVLSPSGSGTVRFRDTNRGSKAQTSLQANLTALPATWSPGTTFQDTPMSAYGQ